MVVCVRKKSANIYKCSSNASIFFFSDGLQDQFNEDYKKFGPQKIRSIISENTDFKNLEKSFKSHYFEWKGTTPQTDDVLLIGINF